MYAGLLFITDTFTLVTKFFHHCIKLLLQNTNPAISHMYVAAAAHTVHKHARVHMWETLQASALRETPAPCDRCMPYNRGRPDQKADKKKNTRKERKEFETEEGESDRRGISGSSGFFGEKIPCLSTCDE